MKTTTTENGTPNGANGAPVATQLTTGLADAPATTKAKGAVEVRSPHERALLEQSLTDRIEVLKKLGKSATDEGYAHLARAITADVATIEHVMLPQVREQREFALVKPEEFEKAVAGAISVLVHRAFDGLDDPKVKVTKSGVHTRRDRLVQAIADRVVMYARDVAQSSWDAGYQFRQLSPDVLANTPIRTLNGRAD